MLNLTLFSKQCKITKTTERKNDLRPELKLRKIKYYNFTAVHNIKQPNKRHHGRNVEADDRKHKDWEMMNVNKSYFMVKV